MLVLAHIGGFPVEELVASMPSSLVAGALLALATVASRLRRTR